MEAWKEACSIRRSGKEPSRISLASYFASALESDTDVGAPEVVPQVHLLSPSRLSDIRISPLIECAIAGAC